MEFYCFLCRSVTFAQRAVAALEHDGIPGRVIKIPQKYYNSGCGYAVKVSSKFGLRVAEVLRNTDISVLKIYRGKNMESLKEVGYDIS